MISIVGMVIIWVITFESGQEYAVYLYDIRVWPMLCSDSIDRDTFWVLASWWSAGWVSVTPANLG